MNETQKAEALKKILADEKFTASLLEMETPEEVQKAIKTKGVDLTLENIEGIKDYVAKHADDSEELSDDQLEDVAGGSITVATVIGAVIIGGAVVSGGITLGRAVNNWTRRRW